MNERRKIPWYRRWWAITGMILALLAAGAFGWKVYHERQADQALAAEIALVQAADPHWQLEDWAKRRPPVPDDKNLSLAANRLKAQFHVMAERGGPQVIAADAPSAEPRADVTPRPFAADMTVDPAGLYNQPQLDWLRARIKNADSLAAELQEFLKLRIGYLPLPDFHDESYRAFSPLPRMNHLHLNHTVDIVDAIINQCEIWLQEQQPERALLGLEAILRLGHSTDYELGILSQNNSIMLQGRVAPKVERLLALSQPTADQLKRLQDVLMQESQHSFFRQGVIYERAVLDRCLREVADSRYTARELKRMFAAPNRGQKGFSLRELWSNFKQVTGTSPQGYIPAERAEVLRFFRHFLERLKQSPAPTLDEMRALVKGYQGDSSVIDNSIKSLRNLYEDDVQRQIKLQMSAALLAAERYRLTTGKQPTSWTDLVPTYFPAIPTDPYDGKPLRWLNKPTGFMVYSIWTNQVDDGGAIRKADGMGLPLEVGVEYFAVNQRRQPAPPVVTTGNTQETYFAAARAGDIAKLKELLDAGFNVNTKTEYGATALCYAAENGHLEAIKLLLERKIDIHAKDTFYTADAITWAQMKDQDAAVTLLLKAGAKGETSILSSAIFNNKPKMVAAVLASGRIKQETLDSSLTGIDPKKTEIIKLLTAAGSKGKPAEAKAEAKKTETVAKTAPKSDDTPQPVAPVVELTEKPKDAVPWAGFRGQSNSGVVDGQFPPTGWDATTGKNLAWKTPIPGLGLSSPVVWGNRLFLTTAINEASPKPSLRIGQYGDVDSVKEETPHTWKVYCLDVTTGKVLWDRAAYTGIPKVKRHMKSSHANATPATDGKVVVVNFGSEGLYCYSKEGDLLWRKDLGKLGSSWFFNPDYEWGFGSSPVIYRDTVIVQCDIGKNSFIACYSLLDGEEYWSTPRDEIPSWCSPTMVIPDKGDPELVTVASKYARSYHPKTGAELWKLGKFSEIAVPTPFYAQGLIYLTTGYRPIQPIYAIKPGARGDISLPKDKESSDYVAWSKQRGGPYLPTPLVYGEHLYVCSNAGVLSCYDAKTGKVIYQKRLGGKNGYTASLVAADGRLYCTDEEGLVRVVKTGPEFQILSLNKLGEECLAHPAISFGHIFFRCREHVMAFTNSSAKR